MTLEDLVRRRVRERNRELAVEAVIGGLMGLLFTALTLGVIFGITWAFSAFYFFSMRKATLVASQTMVMALTARGAELVEQAA